VCLRIDQGRLLEWEGLGRANTAEEFYLSYRLGKVNPFADPEIAAIFTGDSY
jgi:hypothetical protein